LIISVGWHISSSFRSFSCFKEYRLNGEVRTTLAATLVGCGFDSSRNHGSSLLNSGMFLRQL
jgi:hypothetical protein